MANPIRFEQKKVDPRTELERRLQAAPVQHAEALLVVFDILEEAHDQGLLDLLHGAIGSKNEIAAKLAYYAKQPVGMQALRNLLILGEALGSLDPVILANTKKEIFDRQEEPPSLWQLFRKVTSRDGRRGVGMILGFVSGIGRSARTSDL
jgi:uncharacterized protein YjgD (DUF1641 family)